MHKRVLKIGATTTVIAVLALAGIAGAALLGNLIGFPRVIFGSGNTNITGGTLTINAAPVILQLSAIDAPVFINPFPMGFESLDIAVQVNGACELVGGTGGDDFSLVGEVDLGGGDVRSGTLLTGEVLQFGSLDAGVANDLFDFRFEVTGGALADLFLNEDLGVLVQSENSTFTGVCSANSTGEAKGIGGAIPPILPADGCTPGYWKQKHHFDSWVGFAPTDLFADVFGRNVDGITDLESALKAGGGGIKALVRHTTASLLNASNDGVNATAFPTTANVIAAFQAAYDSGDYEPAKDAFEASNEAGCPLN